MLSTGGGGGPPGLVPDLRGKALSFSPLTMLLAVGLSWPLLSGGKLLLYLEILQIIGLLLFILLPQCITLIALGILKHSSIPGINPLYHCV